MLAQLSHPTRSTKCLQLGSGFHRPARVMARLIPSPSAPKGSWSPRAPLLVRANELNKWWVVLQKHDWQGDKLGGSTLNRLINSKQVCTERNAHFPSSTEHA
jgi:hypothetical protein